MTSYKYAAKKPALLLAAAAVLLAAPACDREGRNRAAPPHPSPQARLQLSEQLLPDLISTREISRITGRGILLARIRCDRKPLCFHDEYGVPVGFEVDLLQKIARTLGVKLNVVEDPNAPADIEAPVIHSSPAAGKPDLTMPYLFRAPAGWYSFRIAAADSPLRTALNRLLLHFYETGTYQQIYINWFTPGQAEHE